MGQPNPWTTLTYMRGDGVGCCFLKALMTGNTLPGDMDLLDLVLRTPRPGWVIIDWPGPPPTTTTTTTTTTERPDPRWIWFERDKWWLYVLSQMPEHYLRRNVREGVQITFQTDRPDGLIWFTGNERDNMHLSLRVSPAACTCHS